MGFLTNEFTDATRILEERSENDLALFVLRHGESLGQVDISAYKTIGDDKIPLTARGKLQAIAGGRILSALAEQIGFSDMRIITSTGQRSTRTALELFNALDPSHLPTLSYDTRLDKQKFGKFDGLFTSAERRAVHPRDYKIYETHLQAEGLFHARPPQGESIGDVQARVSDFIDNLKGTHMPTILVTHGTNALCIENALLDRGEEWVLGGIDTRPNCSIRLLAGNAEKGYTAHTISNDPVRDQKAVNQWRHQDRQKGPSLAFHG